MQQQIDNLGKSLDVAHINISRLNDMINNFHIDDTSFQQDLTEVKNGITHWSNRIYTIGQTVSTLSNQVDDLICLCKTLTEGGAMLDEKLDKVSETQSQTVSIVDSLVEKTATQDSKIEALEQLLTKKAQELYDTDCIVFQNQDLLQSRLDEIEAILKPVEPETEDPETEKDA